MSGRVMHDVLRERQRQDDKWGEQNHSPQMWMVILGEEFGEACQVALADVFKNRAPSGDYRKELVQVAAVAIAAIECMDRQAAPAGGGVA